MFLTEFLSFLSGTVFGMFITAAVLIHMLSGGQTQASFVGETAAKPVNKIDSGADEKNIKEIAKGAYMNADTVELEMLNKIIDQLEDFNYPLKQIVADLHRIHDIHEFDSSSLAEKMKGVIELATIANMERDFSDRLSEMKENGKQLRSVMVFLSDLSKACAGFAKELHRLHNVAKTNKNKGTVAISVAVSVSECKEEQILMNWWSAIDKAMHHISADHEELASGITDELLIHSSLIQEDYVQLEKKYHSEASKQAALLKEHINSYESKLRETSKNKEKVRGVSDKDHSKRVARFKTSEEALRTHLVKLYEIQKDFYLLYPRLHAEIQVTVLKSLVETQTQLCKLAEKLDRAHENGRNASRRFKLQLTDAAAGLVRSIREENLRNISHEYSESPGGKDGLLPVGHKIAGYEESLQKVLEGVLIQSKLGDSGTMERSASEMELASKRAAKVEDVMPGRATPEEQGTLNMHSEYASSLAASNPSILPELPLLFSNAISTETCVWFNAFSGRVYRDISNSKEFYQWFCKKLAMMLNKGPRPSFIEEFQVLDVEFGALPPLLLNVKWSPPYGKKSNPTETNTNLPSEKDVIASGGENNGLADVNDRQSLNSKNSTIEQSPGDAEGPESVDSSADDGLYDTEFYAACTADFAFRSGMKFKIATKLQVVYTTVSVVLTLEVAEVSGRIRFGVTKGYSFASFLKDPLTRMNVTSEVGNDQFKLKNIPMLSDLIVKKIKSFIHNKIVYPSSHKMRLVWPRHWWPEGTEHMFESSDDVPREKQKSGFGSPVSGTPTTTTSTASALAGSVEGADATDHGKFITGATTVSKIASKDEVDCDKIRTDQRNSINKSRNGSVAQVSVKRKFSKWLNSYTGGTDKPLASHQQPSIDTMSAQDGGLKEFVNAASKKLGDTSEYEMDSDDEDIRADIENRRDSQMMHADSTDFQWDIVVSTAVTRFHQQLLHSIDKEKPALQTSDDVRIRDSNLQPTNRMPGAEALADLIALPGRKRSASWSHPCSRSQYFREIETILDSVNSFNKTGRERAHTITDFRCEVMEKYFIYLIYCKITGEVHASSEPSVSRNHGVSTQRNKTFEDDSVLTTKQWIKKMKRDQTRSVRKKIKNFKEKYLSKLKSSSKTSANATNKVSSLLDYSSDDSCGEIDRNTIAADVEEFRKLNELPSGVREQAMKHFIDKGNIEGIKRKESMDGRERRNSDTKDMGVVPTLMRRNSLEGYESNARRNSVSFGMGGDSAGAMRYVSSIFKTNKSETASDLDIAGTSAAKVVSPPKTMESRANQIFAKAFQVVRQRIDKDSNSSKTTDG